LNRSPRTTSATYPPQSTNTTEVDGEESAATTRRRQRNNGEQYEHNVRVSAPKRACIAGGPRISPPITEPFETTVTPFSQSIESDAACSPMLALQDDRTNLVPIATPTRSDVGQVPITWHSALPIPYQSIADLSLTKQPEKRQLSGACVRCYEKKTKCDKSFPCQRCKKWGFQCIQREKRRKWQHTLSQKSPFGPMTISSSIPTAVLNL
jgi:hypothetical protein